jgi:ligand-binding sensor domain-containing protein/signal transduction histidine kinase
VSLNGFCQSINDQYTFYTTKNGLPDGQITSIIQDRTGYLWLSTTNGLVRFDGHSFKVYRHNAVDTNSLLEDDIRNLFVDSNGQLWVLGYKTLYLYHQEGDRLEHFDFRGIIKNDLNKISSQENGQLIITAQATMYKFDIKQKKIAAFSHEGIDCDFFLDRWKDINGVEWIATDRGLIRYEPHTRTCIFVDSALPGKDRTVSSIVPLTNGYLLATTFNNGIYLVNMATNVVERFFYDKNNPHSRLYVSCKLNDSVLLVSRFVANSAFISGSTQLSFFNWRSKTITDFNPASPGNEGTPEDKRKVYSAYCDREGIVWLTGLHLIKFDFDDFEIRKISSSVTEREKRPFDLYSNLYLRKDGYFFLGGLFGLGTYDPVTGRLTQNHEKGLSSHYTGVFREGVNGDMSCYSSPNALSFTANKNNIENIKEHHIPGKFHPVTDIVTDPEGNTWLTTLGGGLFRRAITDRTFAFLNLNTTSAARTKIIDSNASAICRDHSGCTWVGTGKGVYKIEKDGATVNTLLAPDYNITSLAEDKHGTIWFSTWDHGIGKIDPSNDSVTFLTSRYGLPSCWFWDLNVDDQDNVWALSRLGVVRINTSNLHNEIYTEEEGFPNPLEIRYIHYSVHTRLLYLLTADAIFEIDEKNIAPHNKMPETSITAFSVFDKERPILIERPIRLNYNENFLNIQFTCLLFHCNSQVKYAYKMDGIDENWVYCNLMRNASYTNLPPGNYTFMVKAQSPEGTWNQPTLLSIIIKPPYWRTWWFYMLEAILGIAFIVWLVRLYTGVKLARQKSQMDKLQAISEERARIASDMHDDLGSGLTSIRLLSEIVNLKLGDDSVAKAEVSKIARSAGEMSEHLREIIWTMNTRNDKLEDFIIYVRSYSVSFFDDSAIRFQFNRPSAIPDVLMNGELRRNIFLCTKEALNNIVKHSKATEASLTFCVEKDRDEPGHIVLTTEILDNGIGIDSTHPKKFGNGLNTMKERLGKVGSSLKIEGDRGTRLMFNIRI